MRRYLLLGVGVLVAAAAAGRGAAGGAPAADERLLRESRIPTDGPGLAAFFRGRTLDDSTDSRLKTLVRQLGDEVFAVREQASRQLVAAGPRARPVLKEALKDRDPEVARRARDCLDQIERGATSEVLAAAVRVLTRQRPGDAAAVLLAYLPSAEDETILQEVRAAVDALAVRDGKPEPALLKALADPNPLKRSAAGAALARARLPEVPPGVRRLLEDGDPRVRLRVGLALVATRDKEAVGVLIRLLDQLPAEETGTVEDLLLRLAAGGGPPEPPGGGAAARRLYRQGWEAWWKTHGPGVTAEQLAQASRTLGFTLVVLLDQGEVVDLDAANRPRWRVGGLSLPLDAQLLPGEQRILVAEHDAGRVTERDLKGEVKWEYRAEEPLAAQRLPGGNTFVVTRQRLVELDKDGKTEVWSYTRPDGGLFMKATKLRNGDIAAVVQLGVTQFVRLTPDGKDYREAARFGVMVSTSGGRLDVLPGGHVLVPELPNNRVVEYDASGKEVRALEVEQPIAAVRLSNGHTLVTSMSQLRAVELDRAGKEVWQFRSTTRVTRAWRR
jgi:hypothetical protein